MGQEYDPAGLVVAMEVMPRKRNLFTVVAHLDFLIILFLVYLKPVTRFKALFSELVPWMLIRVGGGICSEYEPSIIKTCDTTAGKAQK